MKRGGGWSRFVTGEGHWTLLFFRDGGVPQKIVVKGIENISQHKV